MHVYIPTYLPTYNHTIHYNAKTNTNKHTYKYNTIQHNMQALEWGLVVALWAARAIVGLVLSLRGLLWRLHPKETRYRLSRLDCLHNCTGMWKELNSREQRKCMRTLWQLALSLRITPGTSQQHAKCGCCKWEVAAVETPCAIIFSSILQ